MITDVKMKFQNGWDNLILINLFQVLRGLKYKKIIKDLIYNLVALH